jgi:RNA polymerase sigma-70 factor (ECF subfamily)
MTDKVYNKAVDDYSDGVYRFIVKNIGNEEDAKDIVQTAFEKLWIHRHKVEEEKIKSYLFTIAYRQMIDHIRKVKKMPYIEMAEELPQHVVFQQHNDTKQQLLKAIHELNETQKSLILLKDYEGYNYQEIGTIMELSENQVKVYLHRARQILKNKLGQMLQMVV